jgi:hypothetical protein
MLAPDPATVTKATRAAAALTMPATRARRLLTLDSPHELPAAPSL